MILLVGFLITITVAFVPSAESVSEELWMPTELSLQEESLVYSDSLETPFSGVAIDDMLVSGEWSSNTISLSLAAEPAVAAAVVMAVAGSAVKEDTLHSLAAASPGLSLREGSWGWGSVLTLDCCSST